MLSRGRFQIVDGEVWTVVGACPELVEGACPELVEGFVIGVVITAGVVCSPNRKYFMFCITPA
jgi:hypothetical protein